MIKNVPTMPVWPETPTAADTGSGASMDEADPAGLRCCLVEDLEISSQALPGNNSYNVHLALHLRMF